MLPTEPLPPTARPAPPAPPAIPQRTAAGHAALARRTRELTPRQRTALFLVDGKRGLDEVLALASQAGASASAITELLALGLIQAPETVRPAALTESSLLPSSQSLHGDSRWSQIDDDEARPGDLPLDEARALLVRAVRSQAPLAGLVTLMRLKRATTREALAALLDEVEQRLRKPHRSIIAAQTLRHVRHLLTLPPTTRPPVG